MTDSQVLLMPTRVIKYLCEKMGADYDKVIKASTLTDKEWDKLFSVSFLTKEDK